MSTARRAVALLLAVWLAVWLAACSPALQPRGAPVGEPRLVQTVRGVGFMLARG